MRIVLVPWLSFIFCYWYWIHLGVNITVVSGQCHGDQQSFLLQLKNNLKFKSEISSKLVHWNQSFDCCQWNGVTCDDEKGHVIGLDLSGESIYGGFDNSSSLFSLQNLQILNLATNNFNSVIPSGFSKLKNLTYLKLSNAGFVGQIPIEISHLTRLVTLDISSSSISYSTQQLKLGNLDLGKLVQNLTSIRKLYLGGISITAKGQEWCNALLPLLSLQELSMSNCNLSGPLDSSLARLKNLSVIRLDQNNLSSSVPEAFASFKNLTSLHLGNCGLRGRFPEKIFRVATLSVIDISFNKDLIGSLPEFPLNGSLRTLIVSNTRFSGALPNSMSKLKELTYLDLSTNNFSGTIPPFNMPNNLTHLDLSHNSFTGPITSVQLEGLRKLVQIDLQENFLNGSIPSSLFALPLLISIRLSNNHFQGHLDEFPNMSSSMLETLDLSSNNLQGPIPASIFQLGSLRVLQLSSNKLNGTVHIDMFQRLENLTTLDLSHNNLSVDTNGTNLRLSALPMLDTVKLASCKLKEFPSFLRNLSKLNTLDLSSNLIQGSIPAWICQLGSLTQLNISDNLLNSIEGPVQNASAPLSVVDLHSNQLQGQLPIFPVHAAYLDYSNNNFSSNIPSDIGARLNFTIYLSLSKNNLSGSIPRSLCNNSNLLVLDFSYNQFQGTIPECLAQSQSLVVLNLQHNMLHGNIPDKFPEYCALSTLALNGNQLGGPIPKSLVNCRSLEVLNLGNNQINDEFPCFLKELPTLHVMVLRQNKFHGHIGCTMTTGTWNMLQIVDLAFNNFSGSLPVNCFKTWEAMMLDEDHDASKFNHIRSQVLEFGHIYYQDSVTLTTKGLQMEFVKILTVFTSVDFSSNNFQGPIPEELMSFTGLKILNLSHNALSGHIPSSIGNLKQLESFDLSSNHFGGEIPIKLASLSFLSYLNLSFNHLVGRIPTGTQLQTFDASSFEGNDGLYGPPLTENRDHLAHVLPPHGRLHAIDWKTLSAELGLIFGLGLVIVPLLFWKQWRQWYWKRVDSILCCIFPQLHLEYKSHGGQVYQTLRLRH